MWHPHSFKYQGKKEAVDDGIVQTAIEIADKTSSVHPELPPIFSLRHLAHLTNVSYGFLRHIVCRNIDEPYEVFQIRKRIYSKKKAYRIVCVPSPDLMCVQRWIAHKILRLGDTHPASMAYAPDSKIYRAALQHCECKWLVKIDVKRFFESISEMKIYHVFLQFGYHPLVAFEMARICTRVGKGSTFWRKPQWIPQRHVYYKITDYMSDRLGHLPQGAPSSPMLANLAMKSLDQKLQRIADKFQVSYTRYADDLTFSTKDKVFGKHNSRKIVRKVYDVLRAHGLLPNTLKTTISHPGARKVVLGLLVDGPKPRLSRQFRSRIRQHLYYLQKDPIAHARARGFISVWGLRNHIQGLLAHTKEIDTDFYDKTSSEFNLVDWPL
ncbi:MAG: reverse transcriptase family protein [Deltaproteobacteria bacterium]|nr:reverse transcriptase family protein [Deltaproteobacteria bacterium]